ncbi:ATP-binding protein [Nocardioides pacificus]
MTTSEASFPGRTGPRRALRDMREPVVGGVAGGLARHLALPVAWIRIAFVLLSGVGGFGAVLYAGLWLVLPADQERTAQAPGLESHTRGGRRPGRATRFTDAGPAVVLAALAFGAVLAIEAAFGRGAVLWPMVLGAGGLTLLWRQADEAQRERWLDTTGRIDPVRIVFGSGGWAAYARVAIGMLLVISALFIIGFNKASLDQGRGVLIAGGLGVLGVGLVAGPWIFRLTSDLTAEREERIRTQERADVAAHLHDSVLQTLALIQKSADDGPTVARLARAQERELRAWLYAAEAPDASTLVGALREVVAQVEDAYGVAVTVVGVGDCALTERLQPIVAASREAVTNAAKHAGVGSVDVYAEVGPGAVDVFVRDRGAGFAIEDIPDDRYGVRRSILDRMERHGGSGEIRSAPGEGTEVRLHMPVEDRPAPQSPTPEQPTSEPAAPEPPAPEPPRGPDFSGTGYDGPAYHLPDYSTSTSKEHADDHPRS